MTSGFFAMATTTPRRISSGRLPAFMSSSISTTMTPTTSAPL
jgi:hypothetical protein